jgi:polysaccharide export outer membrane protein
MEIKQMKTPTIAALFLLQSMTFVPAARAAGQAQAMKTLADARERGAGAPASTSEGAADEAAIQNQIAAVYRDFNSSYRLGPGDVIAIHVDKHPDDSLERIVVSPGGQIYYSLMGNVLVGGKTVPELQEYFSTAISEYISAPKVTLTLLEANSAKIGVLGDVRSPGIVIMSRPMRVLDAVSAVGGITDVGNSSGVSVLRQFADGRVRTFNVNLKNIVKGRAAPEENMYLNAGDTVIVHGNWLKKMGTISSMVGIANFFTFLSSGRRF